MIEAKFVNQIFELGYILTWNRLRMDDSAASRFTRSRSRRLKILDSKSLDGVADDVTDFLTGDESKEKNTA